MDFYDDVLIELVLALGAALFIANAYALIRRGADAREAAKRSVARHRPGSPVRGYGQATDTDTHDLAQAPIARSITYMVVGFVVMIWALASVISG